MTLTIQRKLEKGKQIGDRICEKHGIRTRRIENRNDLFAKNISATNKPRRRRIEIKLEIN